MSRETWSWLQNVISNPLDEIKNDITRDVISRKLSVPDAERIFFIRHALRAGFTIKEIFGLTKIDRRFLTQIKPIVDFEEELATARN